MTALALVVSLVGCTRDEPEAEAVPKGRTTSTTVDAGARAPESATTSTTSPSSSAPITSAPGDLGDPLGPADPAAHASLGPWSPCAGSFECATLTVPRDWSAVAGPTLGLAVSRRRADGRAIGSLVLNPGGPGASGVDFLHGFAGNGLPEGLSDRFDLVSWDPRGTGRSERLDCTTDAEWLEADLDPTPDEPADVAAIRAEAVEGLAICRASLGDLLGLVGTRATVRDLDALRGALGDEGLTYVGYSYGTTIGMEYLRLYPDRVRAMVIDGVAVPGTDPVTDTLQQARGFERTLDAYLDGCDERDGCPLGNDPKAALLALVDALEAARIPADYTLGTDQAAARPGTAGVGELYLAVVATLYREDDWDRLDLALTEASAPEPVGRTILALRDSYLGRRPDGTWDDDVDARSIIRCADQVARARQPEGDPGLADDWSAELPFWGAWFATGTPGCWGFDPALDPLRPLADGAITGAPPVVVIGTTNDPATPYEQSEQAARIIVGSTLVTYVGDEHTAYKSISDCIDKPVTAYLTDLTPPPAGLRCDG